MEFIDGKIFVNQVTPEGIEKVELKPGTEKNPLLGQAARGVNEGIATLLGRAGQQRSSEDNMMNVKQILNSIFQSKQDDSSMGFSEGINAVYEYLKKTGLNQKYEIMFQGDGKGGSEVMIREKEQPVEIENILDLPPKSMMEKGILAQLAIKLARQKNPEGRLTNEDIEEAMSELSLIENLPSKSMMMDTTTGMGANITRIEEADGGRIGYQTGGITETRTLPPEFIEAAQKTYLTDLSRQAGIPSITTATTQQPGETAEQFANRQAQAQQFQITKAGMADLAPKVAPESALQIAARTQAVDPTTGLGSFQPFLTKAGTAADAAAGLTGIGMPLPTGVQAGSIEAYTSPFQQQVIDTTLAEFDRQKQIQENQQAAATLGIPGAFGGGREGVQRAEFDAASGMNRARLLADLKQRGFQNAVARRQQDLASQMGISQLQSGLGGAAQDFSRAQISGLGTLGSAQQAQQQAEFDAARQTAAMSVQDPRDILSRFGQGIAGLTPMGAGQVEISPEASTAPGASPLMTALGVGLAGADIYGRIFGKG